MEFTSTFQCNSVFPFQLSQQREKNEALLQELAHSREEIEFQAQKLKDQREQFLMEKKLFIESLASQTAEVSYYLAFKDNSQRMFISNYNLFVDARNKGEAERASSD